LAGFCRSRRQSHHGSAELLRFGDGGDAGQGAWRIRCLKWTQGEEREANFGDERIIGDHVAEQLAAKRLLLQVLVRKGARNPRWTDKGIEQVEGDLNETESLSPAFQGVGEFFSVSPMLENLAQINSIEAAKRTGVDEIVRSSVMGAAESAAIAIPRLLACPIPQSRVHKGHGIGL
jgi:hypothetical protein